MRINYIMEKAYLQAQLSLSIPSMSSPYLSALMYEAGVFAGFENPTDRYGRMSHSGGPFQALQSTFALITITVEVITQIALLLRTLASAGTKELNSSSIILISLSLAPSAIRLVGIWSLTTATKGSKRDAWRKAREQEREIKDMGRKGNYKQEVVLFGLKDWVLDKWDGLKLAQIKEQEETKAQATGVELTLGLGQQGVETMFYVSRPRQVELAISIIQEEMQFLFYVGHSPPMDLAERVT